MTHLRNEATWTNAQIQIQKYINTKIPKLKNKYTNTIIQIQIHRFTYTNTNTQKTHPSDGQLKRCNLIQLRLASYHLLLRPTKYPEKKSGMV